LTRCYRRPGNEDGLYDFTTLGKPGFLGLFGHRLEEPQSASRHRRGELALWQCRFWEHQIRDEADYARHVDYAHYNAVKHGLVRRACDWPHSTFPRFVRLRLYPPTGPVAVSKTPAMNLASLRNEPRAHSAPYGYWCSISIRSMKVRSRSALAASDAGHFDAGARVAEVPPAGVASRMKIKSCKQEASLKSGPCEGVSK